MQFELTLQQLTLSDFDREQIQGKFERLEKHVVPPFQMHMVLSHDTHHQKGAVVTCRLNLSQSGKVFHAERAAATALTAVDACIEALQRELEKVRSKGRRWQGGWKRFFGRGTPE